MTVLGDRRLLTPAPLRRIQVGDLTITYVPDGSTPLDARKWFPDSTEGFWTDNSDYLVDGSLTASVGGLFIQHNDRAMLIDAGFGQPFGLTEVETAFGVLRGGAMPANLTALGVDPTSIDTVAITHLHADHIGLLWQTPAGMSTPPLIDAKVVVSASDWDRHDLAHEQGTLAAMLEPFADQVVTVDAGDEIFPGVRARSLPGHTLGHLGYDIVSRGERLIVLGDAMHSDLQITHPELACAVDHDRAQAVETRHRLIEELRQPATLGFGGHFADRQFGTVADEDGVARWIPVTH